MSNFDDLAMAVTSLGGNNTVKFDDLGMPSIMVGVPKMKYSDLIAGGTQETLPWWIVDNIEKDVIWVSKYANVIVNDRAYSLAGKDPRAKIGFDEALKASRNKGEGWHLNQNGVFAAINLWCQRNGTVPYGNTNWGSAHERPYEKGITTYVDIDTTYDGGRTATGSGPLTWSHNYDMSGIMDICGNVWEWVSGLRLMDGEIQIIPYGNAMRSDCSMGATSTEWKAIMPDGTLVNPSTNGTLKVDRTSASDTILRINTSVTPHTTASDDISQTFKNVAVSPGVEIPKILIAAGLFPETAATYRDEKFNARTLGERLPFRGSSFTYTSRGGPSCLSLGHPRSHFSVAVGFRSAFVE